jgi:ankyrin repeat protein
MGLLEEIVNGRTDKVFEFVGAGKPASAADADGVSLMQWCAYYGDVSAIKFLVAGGADIKTLGENLGLDSACFHGHWRLVKFLIENGADVNRCQPDTGESPLHAALCTTNRVRHDIVLKVLLEGGANVNCATKPNVETGGFMRDCRTKSETPLHRAAAFGNEETIQLLLNAGAVINAKDMNGDTPLSWGSWYARPTTILRKLLYGPHRIHPENRSMERNVQGDP